MDQHLDVRIGFGDGTENLPPARFCFNIADPHLQMPLAVFTAADERRIQGHGDRRSRLIGPHRRLIPKLRTDFQGVIAQSLRVVSGIHREHLLQHVSGHPVGHQSGEMRLKLVQLRRRPAMRGPTMAGFVAATPDTAKAGKPHRDLAEKRRNRMVPVVLHTADLATALAVRPSNGVALGLRGNDLLLEARQQELPLGQGQTQVGDITEIIGSVDLHDVRGLLLTVSAGVHQPHNPSHAPTPLKEQTRIYRLAARTPNLRAVPTGGTDITRPGNSGDDVARRPLVLPENPACGTRRRTAYLSG